MNEHSILAPSASPRWLSCTASPAFIEEHERELPEQDTRFAVEGTIAHDKAEQWLILGEEPQWAEEELDGGMNHHIRGYVEMVEAIGGDTQVEVKVPLFYLPGQKGTIDAATFSPDGKTLYIDDLKYGMGVSVEAKDNTQLAIYARSYLEHTQWRGELPELVVMRIYQPRIIGERPTRIWSVSYKELIELTEPIRDTANRIVAGRGLVFAPSEKACKFCPAQTLCTAHTKSLFDEVAEVEVYNNPEEIPTPLNQVIDISFPDAALLSPEQRAQLEAVRKPLEAFLKKLGEFNRENPPPGYGLKPGRGSKKWKDEEAAEKYLRRQLGKEGAFSQKLLTPPQALKALKSKLTDRSIKHLEAMIERVEGAPLLCTEQEASKALAEEFGD